MNTLLNVFSFLFKWEYYRHEFLVLEPFEGRLLRKVVRPCRKTKVLGKELKQYKLGRPIGAWESNWVTYNDNTVFYE